MNVARTDTGYCCDCDLLPGWVVAHGGDFDEFKKYVQESIYFYIDCARKDGDAYPAVFDGQYEVVYKFDVASLMTYSALTDIDHVVTDKVPPEKYLDYFQKNNINLILAEV